MCVSPSDDTHTSTPSGARTRSISAGNRNMLTSTAAAIEPSANGSAEPSARTRGAVLAGARRSISMERSAATTVSNRPSTSGVNEPMPDPSSRHGPVGNGPPRSRASTQGVAAGGGVELVPVGGQPVEQGRHLAAALGGPAAGLEGDWWVTLRMGWSAPGEVGPARLGGHDGGQVAKHVANVGPNSLAGMADLQAQIEELWERRADLAPATESGRRHGGGPRGHRPARHGRGPGGRGRRRRRGRRARVAEAGDPAAVPAVGRWRRSSSGRSSTPTRSR